MSTKSLYVHIPFCDHICGYCDFTRFRYDRKMSDTYIEKLVSQINEIPKGLKTIYVGGGTPTSLHDDQLETLLIALTNLLDKSDYEFTFEANPENITAEKLELLIKYGVNRMSLGVQTSDDDLLEKIGRHHKFYDVKDAVKLIRKMGIDNISLDLMYGLPGQSIESFKSSMEDIIALEPKHVSIYALILEPNSAFGKAGVKQVSIDLETEMYLMCIDLMTANNYEHYEISNFALDGYQSRHNKVYWMYEDFYALGPGASSKHEHIRKTNTRSLRKYILEDNAYDEVIHLSKEDEMFEFVMMGLRLKEGIAFKRFEERFDVDFKEYFKNAIIASKDLIILDETHIRASDEGFIMLDDILLNFM